MGSEVECQSIYSSASALALARYRASLPSPNDVTTNTRYNHELSRISSTTSFSSASSLARHRIQRQSITSSSRSTGLISGGSIPMSTNTTNSEGVALVWQPDPESTGSDPAANLWMEIEARLNRGRVGVGEGVGMRDERGQWVLTRHRNRRAGRSSHTGYDEVVVDENQEKYEAGGGEREGEEREEQELGSEEMMKQSSEFTVSAYFDPDLSTPIAPPLFGSFTSRSSSRLGREIEAGRGVDMEGTAIFNMSAPLIASSSSTSGTGLNVGATPANTPLIHYETIQRVSRVRKSYSGSISGSTRMSAVGSASLIGPRFRGRSESSCAVVDLGEPKVPESIPMIDPTTDLDRRREGMKSGMIRLDSHVQAALEVLSDNPESPVSDDLDIDIQAQSTYLDHDEGISAYTEMNDSTPMPIPIPYDHPHTRSYSHQNQDRASSSEHTYSTPNVEEIGLGIGMNLHLDSIYSLPVSSPLCRRNTSHSSSTSEVSEGCRSTSSSSVGPMSSDTDTSLSSRSGSQDSYHYHNQDQDQKGRLRHSQEEEYRESMNQDEEEEMLTVTDLDTGHRVDLSIKRLDELWRM